MAALHVKLRQVLRLIATLRNRSRHLRDLTVKYKFIFFSRRCPRRRRCHCLSRLKVPISYQRMTPFSLTFARHVHNLKRISYFPSDFEIDYFFWRRRRRWTRELWKYSYREIGRNFHPDLLKKITESFTGLRARSVFRFKYTSKRSDCICISTLAITEISPFI